MSRSECWMGHSLGTFFGKRDREKKDVDATPDKMKRKIPRSTGSYTDVKHEKEGL